MLKRTILIVSVMLILGVLVSIWARQGVAAAQKASVPKTQDRLALVEEEVKQLLLLIDTKKTGKITKQEWMSFMEAEFDRLDKDKSGVLDAAELAHSRLRASQFAKAGR